VNLEALDDLVVLKHEHVLVGHEDLEGVDAVLLPGHLPPCTIPTMSQPHPTQKGYSFDKFRICTY